MAFLSSELGGDAVSYRIPDQLRIMKCGMKTFRPLPMIRPFGDPMGRRNKIFRVPVRLTTRFV